MRFRHNLGARQGRAADGPAGSRFRRLLAVCAVMVVFPAIQGCASLGGEAAYPETIGKSPPVDSNATADTVFGSGGMNLFGGEKAARGGGGSSIPVNVHLWRATLDTLSFMPLVTADAFGGIIITDWFVPLADSPNERFKVTAYILSREIRTDGLRVSVFRQLRDSSGQWADSEVSAGTAGELENAILTRAREMRVAGLQ